PLLRPRAGGAEAADRLYLVRAARAAHRAQHRMQADAARARVRHPGLCERELRDQLVQPRLAHRDRPPRRAPGRRAAQRQAPRRRFVARYRGVLHPRHGMAGRAQEPAVPAGCTSMSKPPVTLGIVGARGHTGSELIRLVAAHPHFELAFVSSRELDGLRVAEHSDAYAGELRFEALDPAAVAAKGADAVVLALPNGKAAPFVEALQAARPDTVIVDLSADYRF